MKLNRVVFVVLLSLSTLLASSLSEVKEEKISFIQFKKITLENLFDYLSSRYDVNIVLEEPMLRYYTTSLRLKKVTIEDILKIVTKEHNLHYMKKNQTYHISSRKKYHADNYNEQNYTTRSVKIQYASIIDVVLLLKDVMHGTVVVRSNTENKPYSGLFDASPKLETWKFEDSGENNMLPQPESAGGSSSSDTPKQIDTDKLEKMSGKIIIADEDKVLPSRLLYVVPFINENIIYLISKDKDLIDKAKGYILEVDQPIKEVLIQGKIISVDIGDEFTSAFDFITQSSDVSTPVANSMISAGNVQYSFLNSLTSANIEILQTDNKAKTIASPMLLATNRTTAKLDLIEEVSILKGWTAGSVSQGGTGGGGNVVIQPTPIYKTEKIGTSFQLIPSINDDGRILLKIRIETSTVKPGSQNMLVAQADGSFKPEKFDGVNVNVIETTLITKHGQGIVLGGLINESIKKIESKVPILGDIPGLGFFFKDVEDVEKKSETIVILTPYIVDLNNQTTQEMLDAVKDDIKKDHNILKDDEVKLDSKKIIDNVLDRDTLEINKDLNPVKAKKDKKKKVLTPSEIKIQNFLQEDNL
ncbi:FecR domain-containing protein [Sulfurimonas sp.]|uniref:FecR domain-containing protein n=1 Tax=Sulfurimonas sp. TaxID=2022749 RepID=UPI002AB29191|nr:FecR domain-containing protein [Sulfurimonas sp.]